MIKIMNTINSEGPHKSAAEYSKCETDFQKFESEVN